MNRKRPSPALTRDQRKAAKAQAAKQREYEDLADIFAAAYAAHRAVSLDIRGCIAQALQLVDAARRRGVDARGSHIERAIADVARRRDITVDGLVNGGREYAEARGEATEVLREMGISWARIARHLRHDHATLAFGMERWQRVKAERGRLAVVGDDQRDELSQRRSARRAA